MANQHQSGSNDVWKRKVGYNRRSVVETVMFGIKNLAGQPSEPAETMTRRWVKRMAMVKALNRITLLGMPDSTWIA